MKKNNVKEEFEKFYKSSVPASSYGLDFINKKMGYINPTIIEERPMNVAQMDVFSRLMMDRIIIFGDEVDNNTANILTSELLFLKSIDSKPIKLYINSPGGSVYDGMGILDTMALVENDVTIETYCLGLAASFGAMMLSCGSRGYRYALENSNIMIHQPSGGSKGKASDILIDAEEIKRLRTNLAKILAQRCNKPQEEIENMWDRDCWLDSEKALELGIIDSIIKSKWD